MRGERLISIFGTQYEVNATIEKIEAFSGHGDYNEMLSYLGCQDKSKIKKTFLVHGDYDAQLFYKERMKEAGFGEIEIPETGNEFVLD